MFFMALQTMPTLPGLCGSTRTIEISAEIGTDNPLCSLQKKAGEA
jgi:hypothetical protein